MKVTTRAVWDIESGRLLECESYEYSGPVALCDRALQKQATAAEQNAGQVASQTNATATGIGSNLIPGLEKEFNAPPGYSPADRANMQTQNLEAAGGTAGGLRGALAERAARMNNPAGLNAATAGVSEGASAAQGKGVQAINSGNAELQQKQKEEAGGQLGSLYGASMDATTRAMGLEPEDINANVNSQKVGWLQNTEGILDALGNLGQGVGAAATGIK